jgi:hypothetical protein
MSEAEELRQRAEKLLAMALKAREQGQFDYADGLLAEAAQFSNDADALETAERRSRESHEPALRQQPDHPEKKQ